MIFFIAIKQGDRLKNNRRTFWIFLTILSLLLIVGLQIFRQFYFEEERQFRIRLRKTIEQKYPEKVKDMRAVYGIKVADGKDFKEAEDTEKSDVVLVHGLDDPGKVWMNLSRLRVTPRYRSA